MNQIARKFEVVEGSATQLEPVIAEPIEEPLRNHDLWLSPEGLASLAEVTDRMARKAISARKWRGVHLMVREVEIGRGGAGGKALQVHVDSLPSDLREAWYAARGIALHEKVVPETCETVLVPEQKFKRDARFEERMREARWKHDIIKPALAFPKSSNGRRTEVVALAKVERLTLDGARRRIGQSTLYRWIEDFEKDNAGVFGLLRKESGKKGRPVTKVTSTWDKFFAAHIDEAEHDRIAEALTHYMRSLWGSGERGKRAVSEKATTWLIEESRKLRIVAFEALELGRPVKNAGTSTQFELCFVNTRRAYAEKEYGLLAIKRKDNARWQDNYMPHILRDYSGYKPRDIVVGDVHPVDVMMTRPDGSTVYPKAISWLDIATNEVHMTFVLCEPGEGIKREHVAMAFEAMVQAWGLPKLLYLDNGSEYNWTAMIDGFTRLSQMVQESGGKFAMHDLDDNQEVAERVMSSREAVIRSLAYNAKGKPKIEGAFGNIEKVQFALIPGWTAGDRMSKKTHAKGKDPQAFSGKPEDFLRAASIELEWYHKRPQGGRLGDRSPNEALRDFIEDGWGKTVLGDDKVLKLAFAEEYTRVPQSGRISFKSRHNEVRWYYGDALLNQHEAVTIRVPAWNPEFLFCFKGEEFLCVAHPEQMFGVLDPRGAEEGGRRRKYFQREVTRMAKHSCLLDLVAETERHNKHMADTPEAPVAVTVNTDALTRMRLAEEETRKMLAGEASKPKPRAPEQWKTGNIEPEHKPNYVEEGDE